MGVLIRVSAPHMFKWFINLPTSPDYNASELASWPPCLYVAPHLSPGLSPRFYVLECLGPDPPSASLVDLWSNTKLAILDTQPALRDRLAAMASPQVHALILHKWIVQECHKCDSMLRETGDWLKPLGKLGSCLGWQKSLCWSWWSM
jgi:hypothetical protein